MVTYGCMVRALYLSQFSPYFYRNAGIGLMILCGMALVTLFDFSTSFGWLWLLGPGIFMALESLKLAMVLITVNELWNQPLSPITDRNDYLQRFVSGWKCRTSFKPRFFNLKDESFL